MTSHTTMSPCAPIGGQDTLITNYKLFPFIKSLVFKILYKIKKFGRIYRVIVLQ